MYSNTKTTLGYSLAQITRIWNQRFIEKLRVQGYYNLKPSFCSVFVPLFENDGQSAAELARATRITKQTIGIYVGELQQRGYIKFVPDDKDKRIRRIFLTAKGSMLRNVFESANTAIGKEICSHLQGAESAQLSLLLGKCLS